MKTFVKEHTKIVNLILLIILLISIVLCISIGPVNIKFTDVWRVIFYKIFSFGQIDHISVNTQNIIWHLRAPRVFLGIMAGASLALSGVAMQAFTRNPLADPYILGISSGASFGAVIAMATNLFFVFGQYKVQTGAFLGALISMIMVYSLSYSGKTVTPIRLVLVGIAVSAMFSAFTSFTVYNAPDDAKIREATFWMLGGVAGVKWGQILPLALVIVPSVIIMYYFSKPLNAMMMGDNTAITLGIDIMSVRKSLIVITALLTGVTVSVSGSIGFVGLVIPHIVRLISGADHQKVIPLAALTGSIYLVWMDVAARMLDMPKEIPLGILTSMFGAPLFLWMIRAGKYTFGEKK